MTSDQASNKARDFAVARHAGQKYGSEPYAVHLDAVAAIAAQNGRLAVTVAYLHDVVEDTSATVEEIEQEFGHYVSQCVAILTDAAGATRRERKTATYARMSEVTGELNLALAVKAADRLANLRACVAGGNRRLLEMYVKEHPVFRDAVYRPQLCEPIWNEIERIVAAGLGRDSA